MPSGDIAKAITEADRWERRMDKVAATGKKVERSQPGGDCRRCEIDWGVWRSESDAIEWAREVRWAAA